MQNKRENMQRLRLLFSKSLP